MKLIKIWSILLIGFLITACGSTSSDEDLLRDLPPELNRTVIITHSNPDIRVPETGTFTWMPRCLQNFDDPRIARGKLKKMLQEAIENTMESKGYTYKESVPCDLIVGFFGAVESGLNDKYLNSFYGFDQDSKIGSAATNKYPKGALIMDIMEGRSGRSLWRGALQALVDFELDDDVRRQRVQLAVDQLLSRFPPN